MTDDTLEAIAEIALSHYQGQPIDWDDLFDRAERELDIDLPEDWTDPEAKRIKSHVRKARKEASQ